MLAGSAGAGGRGCPVEVAIPVILHSLASARSSTVGLAVCWLVSSGLLGGHFAAQAVNGLLLPEVPLG